MAYARRRSGTGEGGLVAFPALPTIEGSIEGMPIESSYLHRRERVTGRAPPVQIRRPDHRAWADRSLPATSVSVNVIRASGDQCTSCGPGKTSPTPVTSPSEICQTLWKGESCYGNRCKTTDVKMISSTVSCLIWQRPWALMVTMYLY